MYKPYNALSINPIMKLVNVSHSKPGNNLYHDFHIWYCGKAMSNTMHKI